MDYFYIGQVCLFPYDFTPRYFAPCDGSLLSVADFTPLFALIGTQFGGDGRTTFALPKLEPVNAATGSLHYYMCLEGVFPSRDE